jgi:hypothetical protein
LVPADFLALDMIPQAYRPTAAAAPGVVQADLLQFQFNSNGPAITAAPGGRLTGLTYTVATGQLHIDAVPVSLDGALLPVPGVFSPTSVLSIDLVVDTSGKFVSNGDGVKVTGDIDLDGDGTFDASGLLLSGTNYAFGAEPPGAPTPFDVNGEFLATGGALTQPIPLSGGGTMPQKVARKPMFSPTW